MDKIEVSRLVEIYDATPADKKKRKIAEIADELNAPCWFVAEALKEVGCDVNLLWFLQQKIKMQKRKSAAPTKDEADADAAAEKAAAAEGTGASKAYLQKIIKEQDRQLREKKEFCEALQEKGRALADTIREKDRELMEKDAEIRELKREAEGYRAAEDDRLALKNENDLLNAKIDLLLNGASILRDMASVVEEPEQPERRFDMEPAREYPACRVPGGELDLCDVLNDFCRSLGGVEAYLCGRIIEALWCWRLKGSDALRVLQGLVSELIEMQLEEKEASECLS